MPFISICCLFCQAPAECPVRRTILIVGAEDTYIKTRSRLRALCAQPVNTPFSTETQPPPDSYQVSTRGFIPRKEFQVQETIKKPNGRVGGRKPSRAAKMATCKDPYCLFLGGLDCLSRDINLICKKCHLFQYAVCFAKPLPSASSGVPF